MNPGSGHVCVPTLRVRGVVRLLTRPVAWLLIAALPVQAFPYVPAQRVSNSTEVNGFVEAAHPQTPAPTSFAIGGGGSGNGSRARRERAMVVGFALSAAALSRMNRLVTRTAQCPSPPCTGAADAAFTYTPSGRRKTATDARGTTSYAYDDRDRLQRLTYPDDRKLEYLYDGNGNRTTLTATIPAVGGGLPTVLATTYTYDDANRLDLVTDTASRVYDHGYDLNGNRTSLAQPNGTLTSYTYNPLNRLTSLTTTQGASTIQSYALTLGPAGNRERIDEADGTARIYTYDELYRLTGDTVTVGALTTYVKTFTYDDVGNRLTQDLGGGSSLGYEYDNRDRLLTVTLSGSGSTDYDWDADGNLLVQEGEAAYTWDRENRLTRVDKADGTVVEHAYDADGVRVQTVTTPAGGSAATTNFLVDTSGALSHVVAETNGAGALQVHYVRGDDLLALMRPDGSGGWISRFYHSDHIGSVRWLTDEAGGVTDGYTYSAFGELLAHTGSDPQPYAFTGEPYDPNLGFQYHRARWIDPRVGRFVAVDPFEGVRSDPRSLHRYLYAKGDPVSRVDPSGKDSLPVQVGATLPGATTLRATSVVQYSIAMRAVAAVTLVTVLFGTTLAVVPRGLQLNPEVNQMRVQLQDETTIYGNSDHTHGVIAAGPSFPGVTAMQVRRAMDVLYRTYPERAEWYPGTLDAELVWAIISMSEFIGGLVHSGGVPEGHVGTVKSFPWLDRGIEYRLDLDNLRGHNLRQ